MPETYTSKLIRTDSGNQDFRELVRLLDAELAVMDGPDHAFYNQFNGIDNLNHAVVLFADKKAVACGAMKHADENSMEIKRMYTITAERGKGHASIILLALEQWAKELGYGRCILETGKRQVAALSLYNNKGYKIIQNFGPYSGVDNSVCFEKKLGASKR